MKRLTITALLLLFFSIGVFAQSPPERLDYKWMIAQESAPPQPRIVPKRTRTGTGLDDLQVGTVFNQLSMATYTITISAVTSPNKFDWSKTGGSGSASASNVSITGASQTLSDGFTITFAATTGHTNGDSWTIKILPSGNTYWDATTGQLKTIWSNGTTSTMTGSGGSMDLTAPGTIGASSPGIVHTASLVEHGATSGTVTINAPAIAGSQTYILPTAYPGVSGYALVSTTGGVLSWANASAVTSVFSRTGAVIAATNDYTWAQVDKTTSSFADITTRSASVINAGTLPLAQLSGITTTQLSATAGIVDTQLATISTALKVSNSATTATSANTVSAIVARNGSGDFSAGTISAALNGNASTATSATTATNATNAATVSVSNNATYYPLFVASSSNSNQAYNLGTGLTFNPSTNVLATTTFSGALSGNASTVTTNANLTGVVTSIGNATAIANGAITNAMLASLASTALSDTTNIGYINGANIWSALNTFSSAGAASTPSVLFSGTIFTGGTGTTTYPKLFIQPTAATLATTWSTNGTHLGMNVGSGFSGNFIDLHINGGASLFSINSTGGITSAGIAQLSGAGAASAASVLMDGTVFTGGSGTSTFPKLFLQPASGATAATTWSTSGTQIGINAASGFVGNFLDSHINGGATIFSVSSAGVVTVAGTTSQVTTSNLAVNIVKTSLGNACFTIGASGALLFTPTAQPSGATIPFVITPAADTAQTASTNRPNFKIANTSTIQWATGALTEQDFGLITQPTAAFVGSSTITDASTFTIAGNVSAGTNATITRNMALWVQSGNSRFDGGLTIGGSSQVASISSTGAPTFTGLVTYANGNIVRSQTTAPTIATAGTSATVVSGSTDEVGEITVTGTAFTGDTTITYNLVHAAKAKSITLTPSNATADGLSVAPLADSSKSTTTVWVVTTTGLTGTANYYYKVSF